MTPSIQWNGHWRISGNKELTAKVLSNRSGNILAETYLGYQSNKTVYWVDFPTS